MALPYSPGAPKQRVAHHQPIITLSSYKRYASRGGLSFTLCLAAFAVCLGTHGVTTVKYSEEAINIKIDINIKLKTEGLMSRDDKEDIEHQ